MRGFRMESYCESGKLHELTRAGMSQHAALSTVVHVSGCVQKTKCWKAWFIKSVIEPYTSAATQAPRGHMEAPPHTRGAQQIPVPPRWYMASTFTKCLFLPNIVPSNIQFNLVNKPTFSLLIDGQTAPKQTAQWEFSCHCRAWTLSCLRALRGIKEIYWAIEGLGFPYLNMKLPLSACLWNGLPPMSTPHSFGQLQALFMLEKH